MINTNELIHELKQFTGTEQFYRNPFYPRFVHTDGIKHLADRAGVYWLIDYIFSNQHDAKIKREPFQVWKISVTENNQATIRVEDGNDQLVKTFKLEFADFPLQEFELWFTDRTLLLPSEY